MRAPTLGAEPKEKIGKTANRDGPDQNRPYGRTELLQRSAATERDKEKEKRNKFCQHVISHCMFFE